MRTKRTLLAGVLMLVCAASVGNASEGQNVGNGGDETVQAFVRAARQGIQVLATKSKELPWLDMATVRKTLANAKIESTDETVHEINGMERVAINLPEEQLIRINIGRWNKIKSTEKLLALALHEVLSLAYYEGRDYKVTSWLFDMTPQEIQDDSLASIKPGFFESTPKNKKIEVTYVDFNNRIIHLMYGKISVQMYCGDGEDLDRIKYNCVGDAQDRGIFSDEVFSLRMIAHENGTFALLVIGTGENEYTGTWYQYQPGRASQSQR